MRIFKHLVRNLFFIILMVAFFVSCNNQAKKKNDWITLFNGKDLTGWTLKLPVMMPVLILAIHSGWKTASLKFLTTNTEGNSKAAMAICSTISLFPITSSMWSTVLWGNNARAEQAGLSATAASCFMAKRPKVWQKTRIIQYLLNFNCWVATAPTRGQLAMSARRAPIL